MKTAPIPTAIASLLFLGIATLIPAAPESESSDEPTIVKNSPTVTDGAATAKPDASRAATAKNAKINASAVPDYSQYHEEIEYKSGRRIRGMLSRRHINKTGITEAHLANPPGLDKRREGIIDALWMDDEDKFLELAISPLTGKGGLANQSFRDLSRAFKRYRDEDFRTMRQHPITPDKSKEKTNIWCRHQWMTLPESKKRTPERGNLNLIFDPGDLSLRFVRFNPFSKTNDVNILPRPNEAIPNDPVRDRASVPED